MKSRFLLPSNLPDVSRSEATRPKVSLTRRFELQYNASPRFSYRRQQRHQGQALLLAVLIMLLAALLSAGVLAVVSGNLNQTARIADKTKAIEASRAGIAYANAQLSGSSQGDLWRPIDVSPAPAPGSTNPDYNFYYSQLDKVQGWSAKTPPARGDFAAGVAGDDAFRLARQNYRDSTYGKFPDPNQNSGQSSGDAPKFLVKVEELPTNPALANYDPQHAGQIKITSVGLSDDDPNVFATSIAYKEGRKKSPWSSALRSISNWNFGDNNKAVGVPYAQVNAAAATGATTAAPAINFDVTVETRPNEKDAPQFSPTDVPFNVVIINKNATTPTVRGAVVTAVTAPIAPATVATLKLAKAEAPIAAGETIQKAAAIGTGSTIDFLNTGNTPTPGNPMTFPTQNQTRGILANGSAWLQGQIQLSDLNKFGTKIYSSGSIALDTTNKSVVAPTATPGPYDPNPTYGITGSGTLVSSSSLSFPGTFTTNANANPNLNVAKTDLINDGWNNIGAQTLGLDYSTSRDVEPFKPAKVDSATNLARYRALTRNSDSVVFGGKSYKQGVYIDNRDDVEKVGTAPMTQAQLIDMLNSSASTTDYLRTGIAVAAGTVGSSLEQKHLRGWVGPDEFLARGALVEILSTAGPDGNAPSLRITLDARGDSTTVAPNNDNGPVAAKAFRKEDGTIDTGVYSQVLPWPSTGTLFAEGNLRIRGDIGTTVAAPRSLTIVSLGNIYIEGSLSIDNTTVTVGSVTSPDPNRKKLMLMAKKNVIVNPTRAVLARTDVQTVGTNAAVTLTGTPGTAITPAVAANFNIQVADSSLFNTGDYAEITGTTLATTIRGLVTAVATNQLTISSTASGAIPPSTTLAPVIVRSPLEKRQTITVVTNPVGPNPTATNPEFFSLIDTENAINRRLVAPILRQSTTNNKLLFDHIGELKQTGGINDGLKVKSDDISALITRPAGFTAELTNKQKLNGATQNNDPAEKSITDPDKKLRIYNNFVTAPNIDEFSASAAKNLTQFAAEISNVLPPRTDGGMPPQGYKYTSDPTSVTVGALPSFALTGIGLRYAPRAYYDPPALDPKNNRRQDINTQEFTVPLATSIEFDLNATLADLGVVGETRAIRYLGFNPVFGTSDDALTVDSNFYQLPTAILNSTLDARNITLGATFGLATRVNFPQSIVLKRTTKYGDKAPATPDFLPAYKVRTLKMENYDSGNDDIQPAGDTMQINAFIYAQEGSWLVIPGDYFRTNPPIRGERNAAGALIGSYIDYNNNKQPDVPAPGQPTEYIVGSRGKAADLNRNGNDDRGEFEAALQYVRYNTVQIDFYGSIVENQTAVVADVNVPGANLGDPPIVVQKGAVQDWMDKWASYNDVGVTPGSGNVGKPNLFKFINYAYDPSLANGSVGANQLRVPVTDDLLYEQ